MKLDRFINRPVLSTVISIFIVVLGIIGMVSLPRKTAYKQGEQLDEAAAEAPAAE